MDEKTLEFWNKCHIEKIGMGLTGSSFEKTIDFLKIRNYIKPNIKVLEIGIGFGHCIKGFYDNNMIPSAVDVSEISLEHVKNYCEKTYTSDEIINLPSDYFDIIICFNTFQHVVTHILIDEIKNSLRSLKKDGIFALQFVSTPSIEDGGSDKTQNGGESFFRTKEYMNNLINNLGGNCELVYDSIRFYSPNWLKINNDSGYGEIEYASDFVTIPLPLTGPLPTIITGNHVFHVRKK